MKLSKKAIDKQVNAIFNKLGCGIQFNIMDLGKIDKMIRGVIMAGGSEEEAEGAMKIAIELYRMN